MKSGVLYKAFRWLEAFSVNLTHSTKRLFSLFLEVIQRGF